MDSTMKSFDGFPEMLRKEARPVEPATSVNLIVDPCAAWGGSVPSANSPTIVSAPMTRAIRSRQSLYAWSLSCKIRVKSLAFRCSHDVAPPEMLSKRPFIGVFFAVSLVLHASLATAQKTDFFDSLTAFHSALLGRYGDEGPLAAAALDRMAAILVAWQQSQIVEEETLSRGSEPAERARFYASQGRFDEATRAIAAAIAAAPDRSAPRVFSGLLQEATGRRAEAADTFAAASRADRTDPVAAYLAASRLSSEAPEQLQLTAAVLAAATREPGAPGPFMQLELIPDSAARTPVFAPAHYAEAFALLSSRRFREAIEQFRAALKTDPLLSDRAHLNPDVRAGAAAMRENRTAAAIEYLEAAVATLAESSEAHRLLGLAYRAGTRRQDGIRHLRDAVRLAPHDERAGVALGARLTEAGNLTDAGRVLRQTIEAGPASVRLPASVSMA